MLKQLKYLEQFIGNTPLRKLKLDGVNAYVKLEYHSYSGSIKDRAAFNIIHHAVVQGAVHERTTVVESSSGNFAVALASLCGSLGLPFIPVIDPNINREYEDLLRLLTPSVVKVSQRDETGGFLLTRIATVQKLLAQYPGAYWPDQYTNPHNSLAYYNGLGREITGRFDKLDYVFIAVSTGGTITGLSQVLKKAFPDVKIIAVDVEGSVIFGGPPKKRFLSGMGSSRVPPVLAEACIDEVIILPETEIIRGANSLLREQMIFAGASSGAAYQAVKQHHAAGKFPEGAHVLFLCPDRGNAYLNNIFNPQWCREHYPERRMTAVADHAAAGSVAAAAANAQRLG